MRDKGQSATDGGPLLRCIAVGLCDRDMQQARLPLEEMLTMKGIDISKPYGVRDQGNGVHVYTQRIPVDIMDRECV